MNAKFEEFPSITRLQQNVTITEKIHGTNAQVLIERVTVNHPADFYDAAAEANYSVTAGSRNRWLTPEDDNYGFARWVEDNKAALVKTLGEGRHYGEWFGSGVNSGYGHTKGRKFLALFNTHRWTREETSAVPGLTVVPTLYKGPWRPGIVEEVMAALRERGSAIAPGFDKPEGVVVRFDSAGVLFKQVFQAEETGWKDMRKDRPPAPAVDDEAVSALYQPIRLEKLLSKDERLLTGYPRTLPDIAREYSADMEKEGQFEGVDERVVKSAKKGLFLWIKAEMAERGYSS